MQKITKSHISKTWITLRKTYKKIISMKKNYLLKGHAYALGALLLLGTAAPITSCKEVIDESNFAIKTEMTAADYIAQDERFSMIKALFEKITLGDTDGASPLFSVLTARGNYTIFLPTNEAILKYMEENGVPSFDQLSDYQANTLAKSCIIDNGSELAYETPDLPTSGALKIPNLNDRILSCSMDQDANYIINGTSKIVEGDIEVSNGFIHIVDAVVCPSSLTLDKQIGLADNMKIFHHLLTKTTWCDSLHENLDMSYEDPNRPLTQAMGEFTYTHAEHRYIGYTAFVEPDSIYEQELGIKAEKDEEGNLLNGDAFISKLTDYVKNVYGAEKLDDLTHPDNPVNRFVAYHLLYGKMPYNRLVYHYNEYGYKYGQWNSPQMNNVPTNVWEFYTSMGRHHGLVKITQVGDAGFEHDIEHKIYLNRISNYANGPKDDYRELSVEPGYAGILVSEDNGDNDNNALNGYYHPINQMLLYTDGFRNELYKRRIRMEIASTFPELATNNYRGNYKTCFEEGYLERIVKQSSSTKMGHSHAQGSGWFALWGDEFRIFGLYDFIYKLPPVPKDGTYEIRMGCSHTPLRGMAQIYFGDNPDRLTPAGLPYDMRQTPSASNPAIPWVEDGDDPVVNQENDKNLRNQGYLKGPLYFTYSTGRADQPIRNIGGSYCAIRKILTTVEMKADKTYYLRFKSALKKTDAELNIDYFEYASTAVYNGVEQEDYW